MFKIIVFPSKTEILTDFYTITQVHFCQCSSSALLLTLYNGKKIDNGIYLCIHS